MSRPPTIGARATAPVGLEVAAEVVAEHWGRRGEVRRLPSERDQNFRVGGCVLKLAHPDEDGALLEAQGRVMERLATVSRGLAQAVVPTLAGEPMVRVALDGGARFARLLTYLPGRPIAHVRTSSPAGLLRSAGTVLARFDRALEGLEEPALRRDFYWDLERAPTIVAESLELVGDEPLRDVMQRVLQAVDAEVRPRLPRLRRGLIHGDANEHNLLVSPADERVSADPRVTGVLDLGDMCTSRVVYDVAIAAAYAMGRRDDPLDAVLDVVGGYHATHPLTADELAVVHPLACLRLCQSVCVATIQQRRDPGNRYLGVSQNWIRRVLPVATATPARLAHYSVRHACGLPAIPRAPAAARWVQRHARAVVATPERAHWQPLDRGPDQLAREPGEWSVGLHDEPRDVTGPWRPGEAANREPATIHLGLELFVPAATTVHAPLDGTVAEVSPAVVLTHPTPHGDVWTIMRGLVADVAVGSTLRRGEPFARAAEPGPLELQLVLDRLGIQLPTFAPARQRAVWRAICPDPSALIGGPPGTYSATARAKDDTLRGRRRLIAPSVSIAYADPLKIVRGDGAHLIDDAGVRHLDCVNNVAHVGHSNPRVVAALAAQAAVLNTNTRYLHDQIVDYAQTLADRLPDPLSVCLFTCSGSEANDLALRIARAVTGRTDVITLEGAYHGNSQATIDVSPYKYRGPGGRGRPPHVHEAPMPDPYRGRHRGPDSGPAYARDLQAMVASLPDGPAAFICEPLMSCAGQIEPPPGFLEPAFAAVRRAGGLCIADEVQVGFGRVGDAFWGFETQAVVPDLVTLGKPIGNGHPMAAVITTPAIAAAFADGMEFMSTFGGNPVSCAVGLAVLREIDDLALQRNAHEVGTHLLAELDRVARDSPFVGDCRGRGLFLGVELVRDRETRQPAPEIAHYVVNRCRDHRVLISSDGPDNNVIKIKPPLIFTRRQADELVETLDHALAELS